MYKPETANNIANLTVNNPCICKDALRLILFRIGFFTSIVYNLKISLGIQLSLHFLMFCYYFSKYDVFLSYIV